jgi:DNA-binding transcriptional ArsR family regulator
MLQNQENIHKNWWAAVWRGLVADPEAKHYRSIRSALWLYIYLIVHANRKTGELNRRYETIARETGISKRTVRHWLSMLRREGYVEVDRSATVIKIRIQRWKPITKSARKSDGS